MTAYDPRVPLIHNTGVYYALNDQVQPNGSHPVKDVSGQFPPPYQAVVQAGGGQRGTPLSQNVHVHPMPQGAHNFAQQYTAQQTPNAPLLEELSTSSGGRDGVVINVAPHAQMQNPAPTGKIPYFSKYGSLDPLAPPNRAKVEEYKRKIEILLCRYFDKSATKAANIVKYLPTEKIELHFPVRDQFHLKDTGEQLPAQAVVYQPEDILKRIYEGMLWCKDYERRSLKEILHFDGWQPSDTKDERLRLRALMLLTCAWMSPNYVDNELVLHINFEFVRPAYDIIINKYTKDPVERDRYNAATQNWQAKMDKERSLYGDYLDIAVAREIVNERNKIEGKPLLEMITDERVNRSLASHFIHSRVLDIFR